MKQNPRTVRMWIITCLLFTLVLAIENYRDFKICGIWRHGNISANESTLSIQGSITAKCTRSSSIPLKSNPLQNQSYFCVFWEPLLDLLIVQVIGKNHTLCESHGLQGTCCTDLSQKKHESAALYGIVNGSTHGDIISYDVMKIYNFKGDSINCKENLCDEASKNPSGANITIIEMEVGFTGLNFTLPVNTPNMILSVYLPSCLKSQSRSTSKVVCTYYKDKTLFQRGSSDLLGDIVGLSVENEIIKSQNQLSSLCFPSTRCVSWDTSKDNEVTWRYDGCETVKIHDTETECCCNLLTYFAILVQLEQKDTVRHLQALTFITAVGCALSLISCLVLFYWLCKRRKLVFVSFVVVFFFLLKIKQKINIKCSSLVCKITGMLFSNLPSWVFYLAGFGIPALLVCRLRSIGDIYGLRKIMPSEDVTSLYFMCSILDSDKSRLAHYIVIIGLLAVVVSSGTVMLFFVATKILWGLTCMFGTTWGLGRFSFGPLSEASFFLFCIINSYLGGFHMLQYYALEQMKKRCELSSDGGSRGSVMLQCRDDESVL
uniref:Adhesion G protein-coupled receptor G1 n=1 Tax=Sinocyclocheilus anshuiensis TaxID=1608454 RepID=A0A671NC42_9TELE